MRTTLLCEAPISGAPRTGRAGHFYSALYRRPDIDHPSDKLEPWKIETIALPVVSAAE
jgi:hypothetical protein